MGAIRITEDVLDSYRKMCKQKLVVISGRSMSVS